MRRRFMALAAAALVVGCLAVAAIDCGGGDGSTGSSSSGDGGGVRGGSEGGLDGAPSIADDASTEDTGGAASGLTSCGPGGPDRAVVIAVMGSSPEIRVMTQRGGTLVDRGHTFPLTVIPERVAMRPDGQEAMIVYGQSGTKQLGVLTVSLSRDGATASLGTPVALAGELTPFGLDYVSNDRALIAVSGTSSHLIVTLDRNGGAFAETTRVPAPGAFPLKLLRRPGTAQALLARCDLANETTTSVNLLDAQDGGGYVAQGTVGSVRPPSIDLAAGANGSVAYSPSSDPEDPITSSHLDAGGFLTVLTVSDAGVGPGSLPRLPLVASNVAADPLGRFLVMPGDLFELDPSSGTPIVKSYTLLTMPLDASGRPQPLYPASPSFPGLLFDDLEISPTGHLIDSLALYDQDRHPLEIRAQPSPGQWTVCQSIDQTSASHVAIAP